MADFTFTCPSCAQPIETDDQWSGQEANCPHCDNRIRVPGNPVVQKQPPKNCPHCGQSIKQEASVCRYCKKSTIPPVTCECPLCSESFTLPDEQLGKPINCPVCKHLILIDRLTKRGVAVSQNSTDSINTPTPAPIRPRAVPLPRYYGPHSVNGQYGTSSNFISQEQFPGDGLAKTGFILALVGFFVFMPLCIAGMILGFISLGKPRSPSGRNMSKFAIILGIVGIALWVIFGFIWIVLVVLAQSAY